MKKAIITFLMLASIVFGVQAQSDNITKAYEALGNNDLETSLSYVKAELAKNPKDAEAHFIAATILGHIGETERALKAYSTVLKYAQNNELKYDAYRNMALIYDAMGNELAYAVNIEKAAPFAPTDEEKEACYIQAAQSYLDNDDIASSEKIAIKLKDNTEALAIMAQIRYHQKKYDECIQYATKSIDHDFEYPTDATHYYFRHLAYIEKKDYAKAAADIVSAIDIDGNYEPDMIDFAKNHYDAFINYIKLQQSKETDNAKWPFLAGYISIQTKHYSEATKYYTECYIQEQQWMTAILISNSLYAQGNINQAKLWAERALQHDKENQDNQFQYALCLYYRGNIDSALIYAKQAIKDNKTNNTYLHLYAQLSTIKGNYAEALATYNYIIDSLLYYPVPYYVLNRAKIYSKLNNQQATKDNYALIIENEADTTENTCRQQAYLALGDKENAIRLQEEILAMHPDNEQAIYNAACFYSLLGDNGKALYCLQKTLERNITYYFEMQKDLDLSNIRNTQEYKKIEEEYKTKIDKINTSDPLPPIDLYDNTSDKKK